MLEAIEFAATPAVTVAGVIIIVGILSETFEVMLLPRRVPRRVRPVRIFLAVYGPFSMVMLMITWALGLILGFGLLRWGVDSGLDSRRNLTSQLYASGLTFFTRWASAMSAPDPPCKAN
jgi:hypothetical protein